MLQNKDFVNTALTKDDASQRQYTSSFADHNLNFAPAVHLQQPIYPGGYNDITGQSGKYLPYVHTAGMENNSYSIYDETPPHPMYGYTCNPPMVQRRHALDVSPWSLATSGGQLYSAQHYPTPDLPHGQQLVQQNYPHVVPPTSLSYSKLSENIALQRARLVASQCYIPSFGSSCRDSTFAENSGSSNFLQQELDGYNRVGGLWSVQPKSLNGESSLAQLSAVNAPDNNFEMACQQNKSFYKLASHPCPSYKGKAHNQNWTALNESGLGGRCSDFSCGCNLAHDTPSERNRGPRAYKPRSRTSVNGTMVDNFMNDTFADIYIGCYKNFVTDYQDAKFFVIKSYSEDNVHNSIKYGVWASTPNGNKKLETAYFEAKEKQICPIFLFFSVNASAQFCGVAEMVGPVDFDKSVDYWQQSKWSGQFPVKWHIIKDVPNTQFRHIILENNDNKPVTNSRDMQEVGLKQGIEILNVFKNYETCSSILDDFQFYEERQRAHRERKSRLQETITEASRKQAAATLSNELVNKMSKSFAQSMLLNEDRIAGASSGWI